MTLEWISQIPKIRTRQRYSHKGTYGKVLILGGSCGMSGAPILAGIAALRGGAGLVQVAAPSGIQPIVAMGNPCFTTFPLAQDEEGFVSSRAIAQLPKITESATTIVLGPGLGQGKDVAKVVAAIMQLPKPIVLDADGLNAMTQLPEDTLATRNAPTVLTPHPGEFARMLNCSITDVQTSRANLAIQYAQKHQCILALKGHETIVTNGTRAYRNTTGNPGMATGGSGDILAGLLGALLAQGFPAFEATQLGVYLHGAAGDFAAKAIGEVSLIASDLLEYLPIAIENHQASEC